MRRIVFNPTWEEQQEEKRKYFAGLSYQERLKYFFKTQKMFNVKSPIMRYDLELSDFIRTIPYR